MLVGIQLRSRERETGDLERERREAGVDEENKRERRWPGLPYVSVGAGAGVAHAGRGTVTALLLGPRARSWHGVVRVARCDGGLRACAEPLSEPEGVWAAAARCAQRLGRARARSANEGKARHGKA